MTSRATFGLTPCEYGKRAIAFLIDLLAQLVPAIGIAALGIGLLFPGATRFFGVFLIVMGTLYFIAFPIYNAIRQGSTGQTVGKKQQSIALVKVSTGEPVGILYSFLRLAIAWILNSLTGGIFFVVDLVFPAFDKQKQRVVDKILGTLVVDAQWQSPVSPSNLTHTHSTQPPSSGSIQSLL